MRSAGAYAGARVRRRAWPPGTWLWRDRSRFWTASSRQSSDPADGDGRRGNLELHRLFAYAVVPEPKLECVVVAQVVAEIPSAVQLKPDQASQGFTFHDRLATVALCGLVTGYPMNLPRNP